MRSFLAMALIPIQFFGETIIEMTPSAPQLGREAAASWPKFIRNIPEKWEDALSHFELEKNPRHSRLFELIRQKNQSDQTVARIKGFRIRKISADEVEELLRSANRSLQMRH
jgi:hypothetical protein